MNYAIKQADLKQKSDCLVVGIFADKQFSVTAKQLDVITEGYLTKLLKEGDLTGAVGQTLLLQQLPQVAAKRVLLVGCGSKENFNEQIFRKIIIAATAVLKTLHAKEITNYLIELPLKQQDIFWKIRQAVQITEDMFYVFDQFKSKKSNPRVLQTIIWPVAERAQVKLAEQALREAVAIVDGIQLTKNLGNLPANICTPTYFAKQAQSLAKAYKSVQCDVLEEAAMQKLGMGALLSVARGSRESAKLVILKYFGAQRDKKPVVLVGKGVTFDSGGLSLKTAVGMEEMKFDMCGAASVMGTFKAVVELGLPINVVAVMPMTENLPDGNASKPGDVVKTMSGQTVEIMNTDAEGRLILCDALTYAERFKPDVVIDVATLTGAVIISLGAVASGLMTNDQALANDLIHASEQTGDRVWQLPLWDDYQEQIDSNIADMANVGLGGAKAITAACFLARFTRQYHWAHLDVAGTAWRSGKDKLATGRPVSLLVQYLLNRCKKGKK